MKKMTMLHPPSDKQLAFLAAHKTRCRKVTCFKILLFFLFLLQWELTTQLHLVNSFIFSSPSRIILTFFTMLKSGDLFLHVGITLLETLVSFLLVTALTLGAASLLWYFTFAADVAEPYLVVLNSLPKSALAPLFIVWFGTGFKTIVIAGISVAVFGSVLQLYQYFLRTDPELYKLIFTLGGQRRHILRYILLPGSRQMILSGMKVNIGLCLVGVVIGEFLAARQGLGYLIIYGSQVFKLDWVLLSIMILCLIAMGMYKIIDLFTKKESLSLTREA